MFATSPSVNFVHRSCARVCAVQVLYQRFYLKNSIDEAIKNTLSIIEHDNNKQAMISDKHAQQNFHTYIAPDEEFLNQLLHGVINNQSQIMTAIIQCLPSKYQFKDLDIILNFILQLGMYEMLHCHDIEPKVVISEYIAVSKLYFAGKEYSLVNFVLDQARLNQELAKKS